MSNDPEEVLALKKRKIDEEATIKRVMEKVMKESNDKRDAKRTAKEFLDNFNSKRQKATEFKHKANVEDEKLLVETRQSSIKDVFIS